jgi:hypothetical protein
MSLEYSNFRNVSIVGKERFMPCVQPSGTPVECEKFGNMPPD